MDYFDIINQFTTYVQHERIFIVFALLSLIVRKYVNEHGFVRVFSVIMSQEIGIGLRRIFSPSKRVHFNLSTLPRQNDKKFKKLIIPIYYAVIASEDISYNIFISFPINSIVVLDNMPSVGDEDESISPVIYLKNIPYFSAFNDTPTNSITLNGFIYKYTPSFITVRPTGIIKNNVILTHLKKPTSFSILLFLCVCVYTGLQGQKSTLFYARYSNLCALFRKRSFSESSL